MNPSKRLLRGAVLVALIVALAACSPTTSGGTPATTTTASDSSSDSGTSTSASSSGSTSAAEAVASIDVSGLATEVVWDASNAVAISLNGDGADADSNSVTVAGSTVTITTSGTFCLSGTLNDGMVIVDTQEKEPVTLILAGVDITNRRVRRSRSSTQRKSRLDWPRAPTTCWRTDRATRPSIRRTT